MTKCLIIEKHDKETGFSEEQLQILKGDCNNFFGTFPHFKNVVFEVYTNRNAKKPNYKKDVKISVYKNITYRINGFPEIGFLPHSFIFIQSTDGKEDDKEIYEIWFEKRDLLIILARYRRNNWKIGRSNQYGRARLSVVIDGTVPKTINRLS